MATDCGKTGLCVSGGEYDGPTGMWTDSRGQWRRPDEWEAHHSLPVGGTLPTTQAPANWQLPATNPGGTPAPGSQSGSQGYSGGLLTGLTSAVKVDQGSVGQYSPDLVEDRMERILSDGSLGSFLGLARTGAAQAANSRGLLNSSMAAGAGEKAAIETALPIASQDSNSANQFRLNTQAFDYNSALQNAQEANKFGLLGNEFQYNTRLAEQDNEVRLQLAQMDIDQRQRENYTEQLNTLTQQYMIQRNEILSNPDLAPSEKNRMIADLELIQADTIANFGVQAGYDTQTFSSDTNILSYVSDNENLTPQQNQTLNNISPVVAAALDDSQTYSFDQLSDLENVNPNYVDMLDPNAQYSASDLAKMANVNPAFLDVLNQDLVYTPDQIALLKDVDPVMVNFLKDSKYGYTTEQLGLMRNIDTKLLQYIKQGARYEPYQLAPLSGIDSSLISGIKQYSATPEEVRKAAAAVGAYKTSQETTSTADYLNFNIPTFQGFGVV